MGLRTRWLIFSGLFLATSVHAGVSVEYASNVDFAQYRSFTFIEGVAAEDPQVEVWLHDAITKELRDKGLQMLAEGGDPLVRTRLTVREEQRLEVDILGQGSILEGDTIKVTPGEYAREVGRGTVIVEMLDGYSKLQVWQGVAAAVTGTETGKSSGKRIQRVVNKMFRRFPPR